MNTTKNNTNTITKKRKLPLGEIQNRVNNAQTAQPDVFKRLSATSKPFKKRQLLSKSQDEKSLEKRVETQSVDDIKNIITTPMFTPRKEITKSPLVERVPQSRIPFLGFDFPKSPLKLSQERTPNKNGGDGSLGSVRSRIAQSYRNSKTLSSPERQNRLLKKNLLTDLMQSQITEETQAINSTPKQKSSLKQGSDCNTGTQNNSYTKLNSSNTNSDTKKRVTFDLPNDEPKQEFRKSIISSPLLPFRSASPLRITDSKQQIESSPLKESLMEGTKPETEMNPPIDVLTEKENSILESSDSHHELMKLLLHILKRQDEIDRKLELLLLSKK